MDDTITIPRSSAEALLEVARNILNSTEPTGPQNKERAEVVFTNTKRRQLAEAVYQVEKALYELDTKAAKQKQQTELKEQSYDYSRSKENWIAR